MGVYVDTIMVRGIKAPSEFSVFDSEEPTRQSFQIEPRVDKVNFLARGGIYTPITVNWAQS